MSAENTHATLTTIREDTRTMADEKLSRKQICRNYYVAGKTTKICPACSQEKPLTAFPIAKSLPSGRASHCYECRKTRYPYNALKKKEIHIRHRYGIELVEYSALFEKQGGKCGICKTQLILGRTTHLDHCHSTGKVRGFLCFLCNVALGKFKDRTDLLRKAIAYLEGSRDEKS